MIKHWWMLWVIGVSGFAAAAQPMGCLIEPQQVAEIGTPVIGVVQRMLVERGDTVAKGQVMALLRGGVERAAVSVATKRAQAEADRQAAQANLDFTRQKLERAHDLLAKKFISQQALDQVQTEYEVAEQKLAQAVEQKAVAKGELGLATAQLAQRSIRSPFSGVVAERYLSIGERVEDAPLFKVAQVNPLKVQVVVPVALYGKIKPGTTASVQPQLPGAEPVSATVTLVDKLIDAPSNTFRVQLRLPNPDLSLPAGLRCLADFGLEGSATGGKTAGGPAAQPVQPASFEPGRSLPVRKPATSAEPKRS